MNEVKPYKQKETGKKEQVAEMFDSIAGNYDFLNHFLSLNIDKIWRKKAIKIVKHLNPQYILDVATGTGDFAIASLKLNPRKIEGIDISEKMIEIGRQKIEKLGKTNTITLSKGDSENISFPDNSFDLITVAFGVRNFENLEKGLSEMLRVLKPGGRVVILEFSKPRKFPFKQLYKLYFKFILPIMGKMVSRDNRAYSYLPESVYAFPDFEHFTSVLTKIGFANASFKPLTFGIASMYSAQKEKI